MRLAIVVPVVLAVLVGAFVFITSHSGAHNLADAADANCASPAAYVVPDKPASAGDHRHHGSGGTASPAASATDTASAASATDAASPTTADTGTASPTDTASPTTSATDTASPAASATPTASATTSATDAASPTTADTGTASPAASATDTATATPCPSASATDTATTTAANVNCDIIVPANPLSAKGLATPYQLTGPDGMSPDQSGCTMANAANLGAFVQATILNTRTGQIYVYDPLVITQGTTPAVAPVVPTLPRNYVATIDFGFNGTVLTQVGATRYALRQGNCVNGQGGTEFGQVSFCNGTKFFNAAFSLERQGKLKVPSAGTSSKIVASGGRFGGGQACPVVRNFDMVDQDQSDNVTTTYLLDPATGQTAQDTTANAGNLAGATQLGNGSDNALLDAFLDPVLGCTPFTAPDLANSNQPATSQALDELSAAKNSPAVVALVPQNDEMVLDGQGNMNLAKTNLYRAEVGQAPVSRANNKANSPAMYCQNMINIQTPFLAANQTLLATGQTPVADTGDNLFTFMANRLSMSFENLGCQNFGLTDPVSVTLDGNGVAVAATFDTTQQTPTNTTGTATASPSASPSQSAWTGRGWGHRRGRHHHELMNPSGM